MATRQDILNTGFPGVDLPDDPKPGDGPTNQTELDNYGTTAQKVRDSSEWGDFLAGLAVPTTKTGQAVAGDAHTAVKPGLIVTVQATTPALGIRSILVTGAPAAGECRVDYSSAGVPTISFNAGDAVTECAYHQLAVPAVLVTTLQETV